MSQEEDGNHRYVRRMKKLEAERDRQKKHGRTLFNLDRLTAKRASEASKKRKARESSASKRARRR